MTPRLAGIILAAALTTCAPLAQAGILTFDLSYAGDSASATGFVSFDDTVLPNSPIFLLSASATTLGVVDWSLTVTGAGSGNGTFVLADLQTVPGEEDGWVWRLSAPVDLTKELVGQAGFNDFNWCANSFSCGNPLAPGGTAIITIKTAGESGDELVLVSMTPRPVPAPGSLALLGIGLLAGFTRVGRGLTRR